MRPGLQLPEVDGDWEAFVRTYGEQRLADARKLVSLLKSEPAQDAAAVLARWNDVDLALGDASALASLLAQVHPSAPVREAAESLERDVDRLATDLGLDRELYDVFAGLSADTDQAGGADQDTRLDEGAARVLRLTLRDFRRSGVDRDEPTRDRIRGLRERRTEVGQQFSRNIRDDVRSIRIKPEQLAGLPQDYVDAHPAESDGLVSLTTDYPDVIPFRTFARDRSARSELVVAFLNRAWPVNDAVLAELLALRAELAGLLGYANWADYDAEVKMVGSGAAIAEFIDGISARAQQSAERDRDVLLDRMRLDQPDTHTMDATSTSYYAELVRRENFDVDAQQVRQYLDFTRVRDGLLAVTGRLFGLRYAPVPDAPSWHADVSSYDVFLADDSSGPADGPSGPAHGSAGGRIGRIHLDLHPRAGKYKHAAQFTLASGIRDRQLPEGVLVCNFPRGLMEHSDVVTLFHEFGHLLHHVLAGDQQWARFSGVATEWDFVEAPSQMLEEWAWDAEVLQAFARDDAGTPIPAELVTRMRAGKEFGKGYQARGQMFYAALSYRLHAGPLPVDLTACVQELQARYDMFDYIPGTHFHTSFGHLEGYTSAYYTYMWSLVIAKDLFSAFDPADLFDPEVARRYRDRVLVPGGSRDAADLVADFLGRPYDFEAFTRWLAEQP